MPTPVPVLRMALLVGVTVATGAEVGDDDDFDNTVLMIN